MEETDNVELNLKCSGESQYLQQVSLLSMLMHRLILSKCMYVDFYYEMLRNYIMLIFNLDCKAEKKWYKKIKKKNTTERERDLHRFYPPGIFS